MADRDSFSLSGSIDDINISSTDQIAASELDAFFNGDPDELEEIENPKVKKPEVKPPVKKPVPPVKKAEEAEAQEEEEDNDTIIDKMIRDEEEENDDNPPEEESNEDAPEGEVNQFQAMAEDLLDLGIFTQEEGEEPLAITTPEEFRDRFFAESKKSAAVVMDKFLARYGEDYQEAFKAIYVDGVNPRQYWQATSEIEDIEAIDLTDVSNQRYVLKEYYKTLKWDDTKIATKIEKLESYDNMAEEAADIHQVLVQKSKDKKEQMVYQQEQMNQRKEAQQKLYIQSVNQILSNKLTAKEFDGIPVDNAFARQTQSFLLEEKYQTPDGQQLTEFDKYILELKRPDNFEKRVKLAMLAQLLEVDPTLSKIKKKAITEESKKAFGKLARHLDKEKPTKQRTVEDDKISSFI